MNKLPRDVNNTKNNTENNTEFLKINYHYINILADPEADAIHIKSLVKQTFMNSYLRGDLIPDNY